MSFRKSSKKRKGESGKSRNAREKNLENCEVYVAGFSDEQQATLRKEFEKIGKVCRCKVAKSKIGKHNMYALILFESKKHAAKAIRLLNNRSPLNLNVEYAKTRPTTPRRVSAFKAIKESTTIHLKGGKKKKITKKQPFKKKENVKLKEKTNRGESIKLVPKGVGHKSARISNFFEKATGKERSNATDSDVRQVLGYAYASQVAVRYIPLNVPIPGCYNPKTAPEKLLLAVNPYDVRQPILPYPVLKRADRTQKLCRST